MTADVTHCDNTRRLRLASAAEANAAGNAEAAALLVAIASRTEESPADLLNDALGEIIGLAVENRFEEFSARLEAFCEVIGPELRRPEASAAPAVGSCNNERAKAIAVALNEIETEGGEL